MNIPSLSLDLGFFDINPRSLFIELLILAGFLYGLRYYQRLSKEFRLVVWMLGALTISGLVTKYFMANYQTNHPSFHLLLPVHTALFALIYYHMIPNFTIIKRIVLVVGLIFAAMSAANTAFVEGLWSFPSKGLLLLGLYVVSCTLIYYFYMLSNLTETPLQGQPHFWFNSANLFFYSVTIFVFGFYQYSLEEGDGFPRWGANLIIISNHIMYALYLVSLYLEVKQSKSLNPEV